MAISTIISQPDPNTLMAAYQTIYIIASGAVNANPVVYFDVYFNGVYYRTITSTTPFQRTSGADWYRVDISDAVQEYLVSNVMDMQFADVTSMGGSTAGCYVRVRGSSVSSGLVVPQSPVPVQATLYTAAVSGGGLQTNLFYVLNMALQHEDPSDATAFLAITPYTVPALGSIDYEYLPLTKNGNITVAFDDYGYAPFFMHTNGSTTGGASVRLFVNIEGGATYYPNGTGYHLITEERVYYLPYGPKNLMLTPGHSALPLYNAQRYKVGLEDNHGNTILVTPWITHKRIADNHKRVFFRNYLGHYEAINFDGSAESLVTASGAWQKMLEYTPPQSHKKFRGANRFNVRSNETGVLLGSFPETMMPLLAELAASPDVYLQWKGINGQFDDLMPIVIGDGELEVLKVEERYSYDVAIKYSYANPNIHTRN